MAVLDGLAVVVLVGLPLWGLTGDRRALGRRDPRALTLGALAWLWTAGWCVRADWGTAALALSSLMAIKAALAALLYVHRPIGVPHDRQASRRP